MEREALIDIPRRNPKCLHGQHQLNNSYAIYAPYFARFEEFAPPGLIQDPPTKITLPSNYSAIKPLVSIIQISYASFELYRAGADQFTTYGYGAYPLICIPYIIMSFMNLVAALLCPEYPCLFLAESQIMQEARARGCIFNGTVGLAKSRPLDLSTPLESTELSNYPENEEFLDRRSTDGVTVTDESVNEWASHRPETGKWNQVVSSNYCSGF